MYFYLFHIELDDKSTISLHGTEVCDINTANVKFVTPRVITVKNIVTSYLILKENKTIEDITALLLQKKITFDIEELEMQNFFYKNYDKTLKMIRISPKQTIQQQLLNEKVKLAIKEFQNPIEQFIIVNKIKGPCIVEICDYEVTGNDQVYVNDYKSIKFIKHSKLPPLKIASLSVETKKDEITSYSIRIENTEEVYNQDGGNETYNKNTDNEHNDNSYKRVTDNIPNVAINQHKKHTKNGRTITGTNLDNVYIGTIQTNIQNDGIIMHKNNDDIIKAINEILSNNKIKLLIYHNIHRNTIELLDLKGIMSCDIFASSQALTKGKEYTIEELVDNLQIKKRSSVFSIQNIDDLYLKTEYVYDIFKALDILELSKQLTEISGNLLSRTFANQRAERTEYLLLHAAYEKNYIFPEKLGQKKECNYTGGLVLNPVVGFYETLILLLDFNSLYPSIIQEFNVCFSTIGTHNFDCNSTTFNEKELETQFIDFENSCKNKEHTFLPKIITNIVQRRKQVKKLINDTNDVKEKRNYDIRQKALKLTANSIYGCLGSTVSRFSNFTMASYITYKGRQILKETKHIAEEILKMKVIYGDTDSIMIDTTLKGVNSNYNAAIKQSTELKNKINGKYTYIEIEVEKIIKKLLLYTKKKYGCLYLDKNLKTSIESKGLDFMRRDFALVANDLSSDLFKVLLTDFEDEKQRKHMLEQIKTITNENEQEINIEKNNGNEIILKLIRHKITAYKKNIQTLPVEKFVVSTQLKRDPEQYANNINLPHVNLVLRLQKNGIHYRKNDIISYVIGQGAKSDAISNRTYLANENFVVDYVYYVENQILPSLHRILSLFNGISAEDTNKLFGVIKVFKEVMRKKIMITTPCCQKIQEPEINCISCQLEIPQNYYIERVFEMLRQEVAKLYIVEKKCVECDFTTESFINKCVNCNQMLLEETKNNEFDEFLYNLELSFEKFPQIFTIVRNIANNSDYRTIQLDKYFATEIHNYMIDI
ncbi:DNA polymerase alpha catalytic subunit [Binucleata daphniae]